MDRGPSPPQRPGLLQEYERGKATTPVKDIGTSTQHRHHHHLQARPGDLPRADLRLRHARRPVSASWPSSTRAWPSSSRTSAPARRRAFKYDGGIAEFVDYLNRIEEVLHKAHLHGQDASTTSASRWPCSTRPARKSASAATPTTPTTTAAARTCPASAPPSPARSTPTATRKTCSRTTSPIGEDFREGLTAIVSVQVPEPQFESQNKIKLNNPEVEGIVASVVSEAADQVSGREPQGSAEDHEEGDPGRRGPRGGRQGEEGAQGSQEHPQLRRPARQALGLHQPRPRRIGAVPGRRRFRRRLGRKRAGTGMYQAILPLRGKPLNVEKARIEKLLNNEEISSLISAIGIDIGNVEDDDCSRLPLRQDHHPDRRRRGRPAHPHAAADVLLPADAEAGGRRATSTSPGRRSSR